MISEESVRKELERQASEEIPTYDIWPETCDGCISPMVIFLGPSPGGSKEQGRREIHINQSKPLWNQPYTDPLTWSRGFKASFASIVESIFKLEYESASKLISRMNMDWLGNPESSDVSPLYMWKGCTEYLMPLIETFTPRLVVPMDLKTYTLFQIALFNNGWEVNESGRQDVMVRISNGEKPRYHNHVMAFLASKASGSNCKQMAVVKSLQHPARIYDGDYAVRVGETIRTVANCLFQNREIQINKN